MGKRGKEMYERWWGWCLKLQMRAWQEKIKGIEEKNRKEGRKKFIFETASSNERKENDDLKELKGRKKN